MSLRRKLKGKKPPEGWELIEEVIEDFEQQLKEAVNEEHEGKRKTELTWKIHRLHWEKNRFIYDLMYQRKVMSKELVSCRRHTCGCLMPSAGGGGRQQAAEDVRERGVREGNHGAVKRTRTVVIL
mgnify:CR=1 FL=1